MIPEDNTDKLKQIEEEAKLKLKEEITAGTPEIPETPEIPKEIPKIVSELKQKETISPQQLTPQIEIDNEVVSEFYETTTELIFPDEPLNETESRMLTKATMPVLEKYSVKVSPEMALIVAVGIVFAPRIIKSMTPKPKPVISETKTPEAKIEPEQSLTTGNPPAVILSEEEQKRQDELKEKNKGWSGQ